MIYLTKEEQEEYEKGLVAITLSRDIRTVDGFYKNKLSAKEMFEKLGYKITETNAFLYYENRENMIIIGKKWNSYSVNFIVDMDVHLAIHQQMIELGWIE